MKFIMLYSYVTSLFAFIPNIFQSTIIQHSNTCRWIFCKKKMFKTHIVYWLYIRHSIHTFRSWVTQSHNPLEKQKMPALKKSFNACIGSRERKSFNARIGSRESRLMPVIKRMHAFAPEPVFERVSKYLYILS